ncbi:aa3-type cytochrome c oxidase subunit IV [Henriciella barbarensis]|uniref:Aa3-type cytochrome c oxidase subunit IV n=1 Tax=Henriciella barbarensis TaxID=86342 RepID=A0A399QZ87_9PROT|nr:aa3-type cytochrome c oxidase subunit IV [Henriciella barbarensis]RIJ24200.1 aa3-type cytochrome c oxidase subunit IV [Henriciella barbarensis]
MASSEYTRGEMEIEAQSKMYSGFMKASMWGALILLLSVGYMVFTLSVGMNWLVALILCAGAGIAIGVGMSLGGAWIATVIGLAGLALVIQLLVTLFSMAM